MGATRVVMMDHIKPELRRKPASVILHCGTNNIIDGVNNPNYVKKIKNMLIKDIKEFEKDNHINIAISEIMYIDDCEAKEEVNNLHENCSQCARVKVSQYLFLFCLRMSAYS